jgi:cell wall-associated NlpC family hydrolase
MRFLLALTSTLTLATAQEGPSGEKANYGRPALVTTEALEEFESLPEDRKELVSKAIQVATQSPWLPYKFGGSSPKDGGFDCSGAMFYVMKQVGIDPPRTSAAQFLWLKDEGRLHAISPDIRDLDDKAMKSLTPGDLLFWGGTYTPTDGRKVNVTHVALYLGHEKKDGRAIMINATDGRSYRGTKANGFGVYDFRLPRAGSRSVFMGYGTPPGIAEKVD